MESPFERLATTLVDLLVSNKWLTFDVNDGAIPATLVDLRKSLYDDLADFLAGHTEDPELPSSLGDFLIDHLSVEDVFAEDQQLADALAEAAKIVEQGALLELEPGEELVPISTTDFFAEGDPLAAVVDEESSEPGLDPDQLADLAARFGRVSFQPDAIPEEAHADADPLAHRYGGLPFLAEGESWPLCANCGEPLQFFVQLNLARLPPSLGWPVKDGLIQLFYCTNPKTRCEIVCRADQPGAKSVLVRYVEASALKKPRRDIVIPDNQRAPFRDEGWIPHRIDQFEVLPPELPVLAALELDPELKRELLPAWSALYDSDLVARPGDKLGGWPAWVDVASYPTCPTCGKPMRFLLQVESDGLTGHQFGNLGAGQLVQCEDHPHEVAFIWSGH
ncbi:MAG: DUF1963 domain-containing protein [Myxococcota bacterium]